MATAHEVADLIANAVGALRLELNQRDARIQDLQNRLDAQPPPTAPMGSQGLVDTRLIGKPDHFDGGNSWRDWSTIFRSYTAAVSPRLCERWAVCER